MNVVLWLFVVVVILLTSCSGFDPYASLQVPTATPQVAHLQSETSILHYWQLAALDAWRHLGTIVNSKAGH